MLSFPVSVKIPFEIFSSWPVMTETTQVDPENSGIGTKIVTTGLNPVSSGRETKTATIESTQVLPVNLGTGTKIVMTKALVDQVDSGKETETVSGILTSPTDALACSSEEQKVVLV